MLDLLRPSRFNYFTKCVSSRDTIANASDQIEIYSANTPRTIKTRVAAQDTELEMKRPMVKATVMATKSESRSDNERVKGMSFHATKARSK